MILKPHIQNWQVNSQNHLLKQGEHTTNNVVTNRSIILNATVEKTFAVTPSSQYEFSMDDITTYTPPTSPGGPGGGISLFVTYYDYTVRVYKGTSTTAFYTTQFNLSNATRAINFATDATTTQIRIEISRGVNAVVGYSKYVDNLKLRKFTGNTSVYSTNYSNMSLTANAMDGWAPDNWSTTSATVDQAAGQHRLVAIGTGATAKVQREFTALPNQEHRFQYNLSLLNGGSATVHVQQLVGSAYIDVPGVSQTQTTSGTYELSFVPNYEDIRISVSGTSRYALQNLYLYLDRDQIDTLVTTYALSRGYRYGFQGQEKDDEVKGKGNSVNYTFRMHDPRLGRFFAVDPLADKYPHNSPYAFSENVVINAVELEGLERNYVFNSAYLSAKALTAIQTQTYSEVKQYLDNLVGTRFDSYENLKYAKEKLGKNFDDASGYSSDGTIPLSDGNRAVRGSYQSRNSTADYFYIRLVIDNGNGTWSVKNAKVTDYVGRIEKIDKKIQSLEKRISSLEAINDNLQKTVDIITASDLGGSAGGPQKLTVGTGAKGLSIVDGEPGESVYKATQGARNLYKLYKIEANKKEIQTLKKSIDSNQKQKEIYGSKSKIEYIN